MLTGDQRAAAHLHPALHDLLTVHGKTPRDVAILAYSTGPGSFTGVRIGATVARLAQSVTGCAVVAVPTLSGLAAQAVPNARPREYICAVLDAGRGEVYGALFAPDASGLLTPVAPPALRRPAEWLAALPRPLLITGEGLIKHADEFAGTDMRLAPPEAWMPHAATVAALGWCLAEQDAFCAPAEILPKYLRPPACEEVYAQRRAAARARRKS